MKKTALTELIEILESKDPTTTGAYINGVRDAIKEAKALLPKEQEHLDEVFNLGFEDGYG